MLITVYIKVISESLSTLLQFSKSIFNKEDCSKSFITLNSNKEEPCHKIKREHIMAPQRLAYCIANATLVLKIINKVYAYVLYDVRRLSDLSLPTALQPCPQVSLYVISDTDTLAG